MTDQLVAIRKKLLKRASNLDAIIEDGAGHPTVRAAVQQSAGCIKVCSELIGEMRDAVIARARVEDARIDAAKKEKSKRLKITQDLTQYTAILTQWNLGKEGIRLLESIQLIADERDAEALKALGTQALATVIKIGMVLSGIELFELVQEFIDAGMGVIDTRRKMKFRKNQAKLASDLLLYLESVSIICLTWAVQAQSLILRAEKKFETTNDDAIVTMVTDRIVRAATKKVA